MKVPEYPEWPVGSHPLRASIKQSGADSIVKMLQSEVSVKFVVFTSNRLYRVIVMFVNKQAKINGKYTMFVKFGMLWYNVVVNESLDSGGK